MFVLVFVVIIFCRCKSRRLPGLQSYLSAIEVFLESGIIKEEMPIAKSLKKLRRKGVCRRPELEILWSVLAAAIRTEISIFFLLKAFLSKLIFFAFIASAVDLIAGFIKGGVVFALASQFEFVLLQLICIWFVFLVFQLLKKTFFEDGVALIHQQHGCDEVFRMMVFDDYSFSEFPPSWVQTIARCRELKRSELRRGVDLRAVRLKSVQHRLDQELSGTLRAKLETLLPLAEVALGFLLLGYGFLAGISRVYAV